MAAEGRSGLAYPVENDSSIKAARLVEAASFVARGWQVLILHDVSAGQCSCLPRKDGKECKWSNQGKHPRMGAAWQHAGLSDVDDVTRWLDVHPTANLGLLTGPPSGFWALDVDPKNGGDVALFELEREHGQLPLTRVHRTGSGGRHYLFALPDDFTPGGSSGRLPAGLDVRGAGGQIVAPGSRTLVGDYTVEYDAEIIPAPEWLLDHIRPRVVHERSTERVYAGEWKSTEQNDSVDPRLAAYARAAVGRELQRIRDTVTGRGTAAVTAAYALIELCNSPWARLDENEVHTAFLDACEAAMAYGGAFDLDEAEAAWRSAARKVGWRGREVPPELAIPGAIEAPDFSVAGVLGMTIPAPRVAEGFQSVLDNPWTTRGLALSGENTPSDDLRGLPVDYPVDYPAAVPAPLPLGLDADPGYRALVDREVRQILVREEAKRLVAAGRGDGGALERLRAAMLDASELGTIPRNEPLVKGWLVKDSLARVSGPSGVGKSFVTLDLAACVGAGLDWHGCRVTRGVVVYLVAEGAGGVEVRRDAWQKAYGRPMTGVKFLPTPVQTAGPEWDAFVQLMEEVRPVLIILDTQARITVGQKENDSTDMGLFVHALDRLRLATGACVLTVHHTGTEGDRARGSTAIKGALQTELMVTRDGRELVVRQDKQKDGAELPDLRLGTRVVDLGVDGDGDPVTSLALTRSMAIVGGIETPVTQVNAVMAEYFCRGNGGTVGQVCGVAVVQLGLMKRAAFYKAWGTLVEMGNVGQVRGTAYWRYVPAELREKLTEPAAKGKGFVLPEEMMGPSTDQTTRPPS